MKDKQGTQKYKRAFIFLCDILILGVLVGIYGVIGYKYYAEGLVIKFYFWGYILMLALYAVLNFILTHTYGGYKVGYHRKDELFFSGIIALMFTDIITYIQISLFSLKLVNVIPMAASFLLGVFCIYIWSNVSEKIYRKLFPPQKMIMIYDGKQFAQNLIYKISERDDRYHICKTIDISVGVDSIKQQILEYSSVLFSDLKSNERNELLKYCYYNDIRVYMTPKISDILIRGSREIELFDSPILMAEVPEFSMEQRIFKRSVDVFVSFFGLLLLFPINLVLAALIKAEDGGPVFYTQKRLTRGGKLFDIYKFRSMRVNTDGSEEQRLASSDDDRITKIGKFIRKYRIDEIPQFINIIRGEMSFVGPRPESPKIAEFYEKEMPEFKYRLKVKAGLTGYAQVVGKYNTTPYDKLKMDLKYITNYSMILDIKIIFMTLKILFKKSSTEGIEEGKKTASLKENSKEN